jgi:hypothetical protein
VNDSCDDVLGDLDGLHHVACNGLDGAFDGVGSAFDGMGDALRGGADGMTDITKNTHWVLPSTYLSNINCGIEQWSHDLPGRFMHMGRLGIFRQSGPSLIS